MRTSIRRIGDSAGIILRKPVLDDLGVGAGDDLFLKSERGRVALTPVKINPRAGWADAAGAIAEAGGDRLVC